MIRDDIKSATITAMKAGEKDRTAALRQISAKIKDRDIEERTAAAPVADDDVLVTSVLQKMAKQRRESIEMYVAGNRAELADAERAELGVIESFLPKQMDDSEALAAIKAVVAEAGLPASAQAGPPGWHRRGNSAPAAWLAGGAHPAGARQSR